MLIVENKLKVYELDGDATRKDTLLVHAHWNDRDMVVVEAGGKRYTVIAADLEAAIRNSINCGAD